MNRPNTLALLMALLAASSAFAAPNAVLRGHITDSSNHILPGATVRVEPIGTKVTSDREGNFAISDLRMGTYTVEIEYVGFLTVRREVTLSGSQVTLDVKLNLSPTVSETVTVNASRERGQVQALNERKTAPNIYRLSRAPTHSAEHCEPGHHV